VEEPRQLYDEIVGSAQFGREATLRKASLALTFAVSVAVCFTATGGQQAMAKVNTATVDQYLTQVGEDASTTSQSFRESRSEEPEAFANLDTSSSGTSSSAVNTPSAVESETTGTATRASPDGYANAMDNREVGVRQVSSLSNLPETGGPSAITLLWCVIALMSSLPCLGIMRAAHSSNQC
jgi:hypothetical protein